MSNLTNGSKSAAALLWYRIGTIDSLRFPNRAHMGPFPQTARSPSGEEPTVRTALTVATFFVRIPKLLSASRCAAIYTPMAYDSGEWNLSKVPHSPGIFRSISTCHSSGVGSPGIPAEIGRSKSEEIATMTKRDVFGELMEGMAAMKSHREGKLTLRSYKLV